MTLDLDTFLTALYSIVDDLYRAHFAQLKPPRPGRKPELSDSEVLTLCICAQWSGRTERAFVRYAAAYWRAYFPRLLSQSSLNRRSRDLCGLLVHLTPLIAKELKAYAEAYQVMDCVPVPLMRRCRGERHRLFADEAAIGIGGADLDWYYGVKLLLVTSASGVITGFMMAPANTADRWVAEHLLCFRLNSKAAPLGPAALPPSHKRGGGYLGPSGPIWPHDGAGAYNPNPYICDGGFKGAWWIAHWQDDYGASVFTTKSYLGEDAPKLKRQHSTQRQVLETVNGRLSGVLGLAFPGARTKWGLLTRIAAKTAGLNLCIWLNRLFGRSDLALATLFIC